MSETEHGAIGPEHLLDLTSEIVVAYINKNATSPADIPGMMQNIHNTLLALLNVSKTGTDQLQVPAKAAASAHNSITPDYLVCLEDGKRLKTLKRYLNGRYGLSPEQYRAKWNLPSDYPMVAPNYAAKRSALAKEIGLGRPKKSKRRASGRK